MKVLLIDPDEYYHQHISNGLGSEVEVVSLSSGNRLITHLNNFKPQAIILELLLGDITGYEVIEMVKKHPVYRNLPLIIYSKIDHTDDVIQSLGLGVNQYLFKNQHSVQDLERALANY